MTPPKRKRPKRYRTKPSDLDLTVFLFTRDPNRVAKEAFVEPPRAARERLYDEQTAGKVALIHYLEGLHS